MLRKFLSFCAVGLVSAIVDISFFNLFFKINLPFILCRILAVFIAISFNFYFNRNITFNARKEFFMKQFPKHIFVYSLSLIINVTVSFFVISYLGQGTINANIASVFGILSALPVSFFGSMFWTFHREDNQPKGVT